MKIKHITPILNVSDVPASIAWFEALSWQRCWTYNGNGMIPDAADSDLHGTATFAAVGLGHFEIFLCLDGQGPPPSQIPDGYPETDDYGGVWMTWWLDSPAAVDNAHEIALEHGMRITKPPTNRPWGLRECHLSHPDGHVFRLSAPLGPSA